MKFEVDLLRIFVVKFHFTKYNTMLLMLLKEFVRKSNSLSSQKLRCMVEDSIMAQNS